MNREFILLPTFEKNWKDMGLNDNDLRSLQHELTLDPKKGPVIRGTNGLRKVRISFDNEGKSSGGRVCYVDFPDYEKIYLIVAYPKNETDNLTKKEKNNIADVINYLKSALEGNEGK